ncbi:hypothetical protein AC579_9457 [Pseudocercospora musae]|uniref:Uncharacterized protein n=1 Tax=Pseudocercospora musae TaxID=113226 RepID=A0A139I9F2_9PEZI|nr:hypothetical protein AC579_9457 [Pseudocercospora musae]
MSWARGSLDAPNWLSSPMCAYCTTLLFPSWLASGTSTWSFLVTAFMGGGVPGLPCTLEPVPRTGTEASAGFFVDDDIEAAASLKGVIAVTGLAGERSINLPSARMEAH